jgi:hypothetical protein
VFAEVDAAGALKPGACEAPRAADAGCAEEAFEGNTLFLAVGVAFDAPVVEVGIEDFEVGRVEVGFIRGGGAAEGLEAAASGVDEADGVVGAVEDAVGGEVNGRVERPCEDAIWRRRGGCVGRDERDWRGG